MERVTMARKERERLVVFGQVRDKRLTRAEAAEALGLSLRQVHRLYVRWRAGGDAALAHQSRGRRSPRRVADADRERALALYRAKYRGFGPTLFAEKLAEHDGIWVSHDTARRWLAGAGLLERGRRGRRSRRRRERRARFGELVQMDGSAHAWFGDRAPACVLMTVIDDATGRRRGWFYPAETTAAAFDAFGRWCAAFGVPRALYVDRHGIYRADRDPTPEELLAGRRPVTQFGRAMGELSVALILARSPQAKGRVERSNGVLQDRLVKELALAGVGGIAAGNAWLASGRFFERLDERFGVAPADPVDAHRPVVAALADVLCVKEERAVGRDGCVQWHGRVLQVHDAGPGLRAVEVWERPDGSLELVAGGRRLTWVEVPARPPKPEPPRLPVRNNKVAKPGPRQQIRLPGSKPPRAPDPPKRT